MFGNNGTEGLATCSLTTSVVPLLHNRCSNGTTSFIRMNSYGQGCIIFFVFLGGNQCVLI